MIKKAKDITMREFKRNNFAAVEEEEKIDKQEKRKKSADEESSRFIILNVHETVTCGSINHDGKTRSVHKKMCNGRVVSRNG